MYGRAAAGQAHFPRSALFLLSLFYYLLIVVRQYMPETIFQKPMYLICGRAAAGQAYLPRSALFCPFSFPLFAHCCATIHA